ncbi:YDG domain-containing protein [Paenibacillus monticola]|nr:YDG domain-containing protein [Paenibacillus monticola]
MNSFKKYVATLLTVIMIFSSFGVAFGATVSTTSDIKGHWAEGEMSAWIDKGFIQGYEDGSFRPNNTITRAEFIALINRSFGFTEIGTISYTDISSSNWAYAEVAKAEKAGYINGYADGTFGANKQISRQEVAVIIGRLLGVAPSGNTTVSFTDSGSIASWARGSVDSALAKGIMKGYAEDNSFKPNKSITRAEAIVSLSRAIPATSNNFNNAGTYGPTTGTETIKGDVVINTAGVILQNLIIEGDILFATGIGSGDATLNNVTVKGVTKVEAGGENSIHFNNTTLTILRVDKENEAIVRIVLEGSTTLSEISVHSPAIIQRKEATGVGISQITLAEDLSAGSKVTLIGFFDQVNIKADHIQVDILEGSIKAFHVESTATGLTLNLGAEAKIVNLVLDAVAKLTGTGTIETAILSSVAKAGTTFEIPPLKLLDKVEGTAVPASSSPPTPTPTPVPVPTSDPIPTDGGNNDTTAPILSSVTGGPITVGDNVYGTSSEGGYLYVVPSTTMNTMTNLNDSVNASLSKKIAVTAAVYSAINTTGMPAGTYVVYAVDSSNNISAASADIEVNGLQLTTDVPSSLTITKMYDGTTAANVTANALIGVVSGDVVTVTAVASYNNAALGTGKTITVVYTLSGADAASYKAPTNYTINTGVITVAQSTIGDPVLTLAKMKDGTTTAAVTAGLLSGVVSGEDVTVSAVANYDTAVIGTNKTITVVYTLSGADAANYIAPVNYTVTTGEIDRDQITRSKVYDGTDIAAVTLGEVSGIIDGDDVTVNITAHYNDIEVGTNKTITIEYTLSGVDAGNYNAPISYTVSTGMITALQLKITPPVLTLSKRYDGSLAAVVTAGSLVGVVQGDDVTVSAMATYNDATIGTNKMITVVYTLSGADAANYVAPASYTVTTGEITAP